MQAAFIDNRHLQRWRDQGCQIVYFQNKTPYLGKFWRVLQYLEDDGVCIIWPLGLFYGHFIYFKPIRYVCFW
jgi:hypothetical protein